MMQVMLSLFALEASSDNIPAAFAVSATVTPRGGGGVDLLSLLSVQAKAVPLADVGIGCNNSEVFLDFDSGIGPTGSANTWQFSACKRSKTNFDDLRQLLETHEWLTAPKSILSFGCSVGIEAQEAQGRHPEASVWGYDLEEKAVELARKSSRNRNHLTFTSNLSMLPGFFDLVMMNHVLYVKMSHAEVRSLFKQLFSMAKPHGGLVMITIFDPEKYCHAGDWESDCQTFGFDPKVAWDVLNELVPEKKTYVTGKTDEGRSFMIVAKAPFNI